MFAASRLARSIQRQNFRQGTADRHRIPPMTRSGHERDPFWPGGLTDLREPVSFWRPRRNNSLTAAARVGSREGHPGTGKTTVALEFLMEGVKQNQRALYITSSETRDELLDTATSHGWKLSEEIAIFELQPPESVLDPDQQQTILYSSDLELGETTKQIIGAVERVNPNLIVLDSLSEIRLLAQSSLRYRRQLLALKHFFAKRGATVLMLDDLTTDALDKTAHSIAHGVLRLD